ncbi:MAG TPA: protocatechuate 3,4-dioxygenase [Burkholderiales bacterium]|jgi:protocatechuate 3,4-dioxygenase beta subunit|nr:protocatechuate 3,4-dioxygenase [Burkholderiales bacterium]
MNEFRRRLLQAAGAAAAGAVVPARAADLVATPRQMRGPFYPIEFPLDQDNDLTRVRGRDGVAHGEITDVAGRVLDLDGRPLAGVRLEIWQVNGYGRYHHQGDDSDRPLDPNFQGYGTATTDTQGAYRFRTVKPLPYPGRAPHIHFELSRRDFGRFTTQMYVAGAPENERDFLLSRVADRKARQSLVVPLDRPGGAGPLSGRFDIVLGNGLQGREGGLPAAWRLARLGL